MPRILLACMPKSGSTFISDSIANLPGFAKAILIPWHDRREQELSETSIQQASEQHPNWIAQQHTRMSEATSVLIERHNIKPVVLVRNIFDVIPSFIDHHRSGRLIHPFSYVPADFPQWPDDKAANFVATMMIPWYFNFYASWYYYSDKLLIKYEDVIADPCAIIRDVMAYAGAPAVEHDISYAVAMNIDGGMRKNKVVPGRGALIAESAKVAIRKMATYYPGIDFSPIGLDRGPVRRLGWPNSTPAAL